MTGFLTLLQRHLKSRYSKNNLNIDLLFVYAGRKLIVHGPDRQPLGDLNILAEITSDQAMQVVIHTIQGTSFDHALLQKTIEEAVQPGTQVVIVAKA